MHTELQNYLINQSALFDSGRQVSKIDIEGMREYLREEFPVRDQVTARIEVMLSAAQALEEAYDALTEMAVSKLSEHFK